MNEWHEDLSSDPQRPLSADDERLLDCLVDGELEEGERRRLLASFDEKPYRWRRCALAFLEAQEWGRNLQQFRQEADSAPKLTSRAGWFSGLTTSQSMMALAASFLLAFTLGGAARGLLSRSDAPSLAEDDSRASQQTIANDQVLHGDEEMLVDQGLSFEARQAQAAGGEEGFDDLALVVDADDGTYRTIRVPLVDVGGIDKRKFWDDEPAIPQEILRELEQRGHRVERRRRIAPVQLKNGRQMIVPVEDVQIMPVSHRFY